MYYYKQGSTYIASKSEVSGPDVITKEEYERIKSVIDQRPTPPEGYEYRLTSNLTWELHDLPEEGDPELTAEEALDIILGGGEDA